ncbi:MAG: hypothetical protein RLN86_04920 [Cyclobacteriaceae bacterium]
MSINKIIGTLLIIGSLALGYLGADKIASNSAAVEVLDVELDVSNKAGKEQGYIYLGVAVLLFGGGVYTLNRK